MPACLDTWLKDSPVDYKFFSDADLGITLPDERMRPLRTKGMVKYAYDNGYDFVFRTDTDAYTWINRLLASGFENYDYMGWCLPYPRHLEISANKGMRTAHGGMGFTLSRKAMKIVVETEPWKQSDGIYWGDIWTGEVLWKNGIYCKQDTRFLDGSNGPDEIHHGNIFAHELPEDHPYITIHPVPAENMYGIYKKFPKMSDETIAPKKQIWNPIDYDTYWNFGTRMPGKCNCWYCR